MDRFCNTHCKNMHKLGVPLESEEWIELGYLMRTIERHLLLTNFQKKEVQGRLLQAFNEKSFYPEEYKSVIQDIEQIRHLECKEKLDGLEKIVEGMSSVIVGMSRDVGSLANKQESDIHIMDKTTDKISENIKKRVPLKDTLPLVLQLKGNCKSLMKNVSEMQHLIRLQNYITGKPLICC